PPEVAQDIRAPEQPVDEETRAEPGSLEVMEQKEEGAVQASRKSLEKAGENIKAYADSYLDDMKEELAPFTAHLPEPVRNFLDRGGWWVVLGGCAFLALLWLRSLLRRLRGAIRKPKKRKKKGRRAGAAPVPLKEDLKWIGEGYTRSGSH